MKKSTSFLDTDAINKIKIIIAKSLASDDELLEMLILKGGNAISLGYGLSDRPSYDLDYSLEEDFEDAGKISLRLKKLIEDGFAVSGYVMFDYEFVNKPKAQSQNMDFWGGYMVNFKLITEDEFKRIDYDLNAARSKYALKLNPGGSPKFSIDISKFEYVAGHKVAKELDGVQFYVYAPELIVAEKLRAICQKLPEYTTDVLKQKAANHEKARARDFYDVYILTQYFPFKHDTPDFIETLKHVFDAKRVPYEYIKKVGGMYETHRQDFESLKATITDKEAREKGFDFYFDYTMGLFENIFD